MFPNQIRREPIAVKSAVTGFFIEPNQYNPWNYGQEQVTLMDKVKWFYKLVEFVKTSPINLDKLMIKPNATIDEAIITLCIPLVELGLDVNITGTMRIGKDIKSQWEPLSMPLEKIYNMRKEKKFYKFLLEILGSLNSLAYPAYP